MSPLAQDALDRLENTRQGWWICSLVCNLVFVFVVSFAAFGAFILADVWLQLSQVWLGASLFLWTALFVTLVVTAMYRGSQIPRSTRAAARRVELSLPEVGSQLINLVQLTESQSETTDPFRQAAIDEAAANLQHVRFHTAADCHSRLSRWRLGLQTPQDLAESFAAFVLVAILAAGVNSMLPGWRSSADRLLKPWRFVPQAGVTQILAVTPGSADVLIGSRLEIRGEIADPGERKPTATLRVSPDGHPETSQPMLPDEKGTSFSGVIPTVSGDLEYRLEIGDSQSELYRVGVHPIPAVSQVEITYQYPEYLRLPERTVEQPHADLEGPQHSVAHLVLVSARPLSRGHVQLPDTRIQGTLGEDSRRLHVTIPMVDAAVFTVHLFDEFGHTDPEPRVNRIRVTEDARPSVQLIQPARETKIAPDTELPVVVRASDDHGLSAVNLEWRKPQVTGSAESEQAIGTLHRWEHLAGAAATLSHNHEMEVGRFPAGQAIEIRARAWDSRRIRVGSTDLSPQESTSQWLRIELISAEQAATETLARLEGLSGGLREVVQAQKRNRISTTELAKIESMTAARALADTVRKQQIEVQTRTVAVADAIDGSIGKHALDMKQMLRRLAHGEMLRAAEQADALPQITIESEFATPAGRLVDTQDAIIKAAQTLLELNDRKRSGRTDGDLSGAIEDSLTDATNDSPLVQLPEQLQQRVGQLMQEQEDLFDEIQDMSTGQADSLNAAAQLQSMKNRQVDLRERAEAVEINFQVLNYHRTDVSRIVELMKAVEVDLRSGRYQHALGQREVLLEGLDDIKRYLGGEFEVRRDTSSNLPAEIQKQLLGSMLDESPKGWAQWNREYFQRLSGDATTPAPDVDSMRPPTSSRDRR